MPLTAKDRRKCWLLSLTSVLDNSLCWGNSMASLTQTVVGKCIPNSLIAEELLKILGDLVPSSPQKSLTNSRTQNSKTSKIPVFICLMKWAETCYVNSKPLTNHFLSISSGVSQVNIKPLTIKPTQDLCCYVNIMPLTTNLSCPYKINVCHVK